MTTAMDLSGTWSVPAFHRACEDASVDLDGFHMAWLYAWLIRLDLGPRHACLDVAHRHEAYGPLCTAREAAPSLTACLPLPPACGAALTACGALPPRWPEGAAQRLLVAMVKAKDFLVPPVYNLAWGPQPIRDTVFTDAQGRIVYHDGFDDLRHWMIEELGFEEEDDPIDPPGSLRPLVEYVSLGALTDRIGPERITAFVTKLREEGPGPGPGSPSTYYYFRKAAVLGRHAGLKYDNVALLAQAHRDMAEARAGRPALRRRTAGPRCPTIRSNDRVSPDPGGPSTRDWPCHRDGTRARAPRRDEGTGPGCAGPPGRVRRE
jgi:hypothetical protein